MQLFLELNPSLPDVFDTKTGESSLRHYDRFYPEQCPVIFRSCKKNILAISSYMLGIRDKMALIVKLYQAVQNLARGSIVTVGTYLQYSLPAPLSAEL
jgi:hypothetical protein